MKNKALKRRIIEISYKHKLAHLGSCLTAVDIIQEIFIKKKPSEKFVLSSGHAGLALYVVLEKHTFRKTELDNGRFLEHNDAEKILEHHGIHPDRCELCGLDASTGSLGQGLPIAVGMALADRTKNVYCLISDGECSEGSIWEALNIIKERELRNLILYVNMNGWSAYKRLNINDLELKIERYGIYIHENKFKNNIEFKWTNVDQFPFLKGQDAHYYTMQDEDYEVAMEVLA